MPLPSKKPVPSVDVPMSHVGPVPARGQRTMRATCLVCHLLHSEHLHSTKIAGLRREGNPDVTKRLQC